MIVDLKILKNESKNMLNDVTPEENHIQEKNNYSYQTLLTFIDQVSYNQEPQRGRSFLRCLHAN